MQEQVFSENVSAWTFCFVFFMKNQVNALILKDSYILGIAGVILNAGYTNKVLLKKNPALSVLFKGNVSIRSKILGINNKNCTKWF